MIETRIVNGIYITILRQLPPKFVNDKGYKQHNPTEVRMRMYEILCIVCNQPKSISNQELHDGRSLAHRGCRSKITRANEKVGLTEDIIKTRIARTQLKQLIRTNSKLRNVEVKLTVQEVKELIFANCNYCGLAPHQKSAQYIYHKLKVNGIDRINSNKIYEMTNCVPCCKSCNYAKHAMSLEEFYEWLDRIAKFNGYTKVNEVK